MKKLLSILITTMMFVMVTTPVFAVEYVAEVDGTPYSTLQGAIDNADGKVVTLTKAVNVTSTVLIPASKTITLDLNGYSLSMEDSSSTTAALIKNEGTLIIEDSSVAKTGTISFKTTTPDTQASPSYASNTISNYGVLTVNGGKIENTSSGSACYAIDCYAGSTTTINDGTIVAEKTTLRVFDWSNGGKTTTLTINDGQIKSKKGYALNFNLGNKPTVDVDINNGLIETEDTTYRYAVGYTNQGNSENVSINIKNGTFEGDVMLNDVTSTLKESNVSITGGTFNGVYCFYNFGTQSFKVISGGTFTGQYSYAGEYLDDNYEIDENGKVVPIQEEPTGPVCAGEKDLNCDGIVTCDEGVGPGWDWNEEKGVCEFKGLPSTGEFVVVNTAVK